MTALLDLVSRITGKRVHWSFYQWYQTHDEIFVDENDLEGLLHELSHWLVASDEERLSPNLTLDEWDVDDIAPPERVAHLIRVEKRELETFWCEHRLLEGLVDDYAEWVIARCAGGNVEPCRLSEIYSDVVVRAHYEATFRDRVKSSLLDEIRTTLADYFSRFPHERVSVPIEAA